MKLHDGNIQNSYKKTNLPHRSRNLQIDQEPWHREDAVTCFLTISCFESEAEWKDKTLHNNISNRV